MFKAAPAVHSAQLETDLDPLLVRFTHSKIRPYFSGCATRIEDTIADLEQGKLTVDDMPKICVLTDPEGNYYSLNNRRLFVFKHLRNAGLLENRVAPNTVPVRLKAALPRELKRYTPESCSLKCSLMPERGAGKERKEGDETKEDEEERKDEETKEEATSVVTTPVATTPVAAIPVRQPKVAAAAPLTFDSLIQTLPQNAREEVKKAMKLEQAGKSKQSVALVAKLLDRKTITRETHDQILEYLANA